MARQRASTPDLGGESPPVAGARPTRLPSLSYPAFAREVATYVDWKWSLAGQDTRPAACAASPTGVAADGVTQRGTYAKMKGCFIWATDVRPTLRFYDGKWNRVVVGFNNTYTTTPVDLGSPSATYKDPAARIYPSRR